MEHLNISGLDHHSVASEHNDITYSEDLLEHYLYIVSECLRNLHSLLTLNLGSLVNNHILREVSQSCPALLELRCRGPSSLTDLGVRYLTAINRTAQHISARQETGCLQLRVRQILSCWSVSEDNSPQVLDLSDISLSLHTITLLLIHLPHLRILSKTGGKVNVGKFSLLSPPQITITCTRLSG